MDIIDIQDVKVINKEPSLLQKQISELLFGYVPPTLIKKSSKKTEDIGSCDIVKTNLGICIIAGVLFLLFFFVSSFDGLFTAFVNGPTLMAIKIFLFAICLYIVLYKLDICIS